MEEFIGYVLGYFCIAMFIGFIIMLIYNLKEKDKHDNWFKSLKPGDIVLADISSEKCDCRKEAMITSDPFNKYIEAQLSTDTKSICKLCPKANITCEYNTTLFHRSSINKINDEMDNK
jgi:hypothetical protein